jgi:hypothetical protein
MNALTGLAVAGIAIMLAIFGYGMNIYKLIAHDIDIQSNKPVIVRSMGIVVPVVGAIEGYVNFDAESAPAVVAPVVK